MLNSSAYRAANCGVRTFPPPPISTGGRGRCTGLGSAAGRGKKALDAIYLKFGIEEIDGQRKHAIVHYLDLIAAGRVDLSPILTHAFGLDRWRDAVLAIANQGESGAVKVAIDQR